MMSTIADSDAYLDPSRILPQHQAALTLVQGMLDNPALKQLSWLDLGCGKGQIIINLEDNLSLESRAKICYHAFDLKDDYLLSTIRKAETLGFKICDGKIGNITDFPVLHPCEDKFEFISLTNTLHEFEPDFIPELFLQSMLRLTPEGVFFLYDMEYLPAFELGAVTWKLEEIQEIITFLLLNCGVNNGYVPRVGKWKHKSVTAWNFQIQKKYFGIVDNHIKDRLNEVIAMGKEKILEILTRKLKYCVESLNVLTKYGASTADEEKEKIRLLYDFWSLNRYLRK